ncbi:MAG: hypothetical protein ACP5QP_00285 [Brevinematia bacterium]
MNKFFFSILLLFSFLIFLSSCYQGVKGSYYSELRIGSNENQFVIQVSDQNSNYIFYSFRDVLNSNLDPSIKNFFDDYFYVIFSPYQSSILCANALSNELRMIKLSRSESSLLKKYYSTNYLYDFVVNNNGNILFIFIKDLNDDFTLYSIGYSSLDKSNDIEISKDVYTNIINVDFDDLGNFYVFQQVDNKLKVDLFSSSFIFIQSFIIDPLSLSLTNFYITSSIVAKVQKILVKFDSMDSPKSTIVLFDIGSKQVERKFDVITSSENFQLLSVLKNNMVAAASYKNKFPVVIFFDPFQSSFKISRELYLNFEYPNLIRGFKVTKSGDLFASFVDLPDNRVVFYRWDLILSR